eukprot:12937599-Prorocentrum_lima.AAC.1
MYRALTYVEPVTDIIIRAAVNAPAEITIILVYAPTAARSTQEKDHFYKILSNTCEKWRNKGPVYLLGDWNARI